MDTQLQCALEYSAEHEGMHAAAALKPARETFSLHLRPVSNGEAVSNGERTFTLVLERVACSTIHECIHTAPILAATR